MFFLLSGVNFAQNALKPSKPMMRIFCDQKVVILDRKSYNLVQVDVKWTKMGQMGHASNENCKKYK